MLEPKSLHCFVVQTKQNRISVCPLPYIAHRKEALWVKTQKALTGKFSHPVPLW